MTEVAGLYFGCRESGNHFYSLKALFSGGSQLVPPFLATLYVIYRCIGLEIRRYANSRLDKVPYHFHIIPMALQRSAPIR